MSTSTPVFPALWYTSNTPIQVGQRDCAFARWLGCHAGPHGTGYRRVATAVPLATGGAVHTGIELIGEWIVEWQAKNPRRRLEVLPDAVTAWAASEAAARYESKARARGLLLAKGDVDAAAAVEQLIFEQRTLVEALIWIYALARLPQMLAGYRLLAVEHEETPVLDCSCGLGDWVADAATHATRGCHGIVAQGRADCLWESITDGTVVYEEVKTKASERKSWEDSWEHNGQLFLNMEAASKRLGKDVSTAFVPVLFKGWRGRDRNAAPTEPKYQHSPLVYGWYRPANLPMREADWSARYTWYDDYGQKHTLGNTYKRTPIWNSEIELPTANANGVPVRDGASRVEQWVKGWILPSQYPELLKVLGPFPRPRQRVPLAEAAIKAEERKWREDVEYLRSVGAFTPEHPEVTALIPRSWNCTRYDSTPCEFKPVCDQNPGWERIEEMGLYERRRPHHLPECEAVLALGVELPEDEDSDDGGEE